MTSGGGKVGSGGWLDDELDGAFWLSWQGSGGGGDGGLSAVGLADEAGWSGCAGRP